MSSKFMSVVAATAVASLSTLTLAAVELTNNGGFETGDFTGWTQFPTGVGQQNVITSNPSAGTYAAQINNNVTFSNSLFKQANIGVGIVNPGDPIKIKFDARGSYAVPGGVAFAEFFSELSGGGTSSAVILGGAPLAINPNPDVWTSFEFDVFAGPNVSGGVTLQLGATNGPGAPTQMFYDNVSVSIVPEPVSLSVLGLAGMGLMRRRR